ncbi:MAG TPA: hypothetical protein VGW38_11155 [Chloroflexota bacterium]|nr:hypothetical protein [Chloroflexota bacterium]
MTSLELSVLDWQRLDGKIAEVIGTNWDHLGILQQMEALPAFGSRSGA